jgi:hypothetical protein
MGLAEMAPKVIIFFKNDTRLREIYFLLGQLISEKEQIVTGIVSELRTRSRHLPGR